MAMTDDGSAPSTSTALVPVPKVDIFGHVSDDITSEILAGMKRKLDQDEMTMTADEKEQRDLKRAMMSDDFPEGPDGDLESRKIFVGSIAPSVDEKKLTMYFTNFGKVESCRVIRDRATNISKGFGFVTFLSGQAAQVALLEKRHTLDDKEIRVSTAQKRGDGSEAPRERLPADKFRHEMQQAQMLADVVLAHQTRIYVGPIEDHTTGDDLQLQFAQYGPIVGVSRLGGRQERVSRGQKTNYGLVEFKQIISMRRAFGSKVFVHGKGVKIALSRLAMEVVLSPCVVFFWEAHERIGDRHLDGYFGQFGQIYRAAQVFDEEQKNRTYGFVDYVTPEGAQMAMQQKSILMPPGQYIKVGKYLPMKFMLNLLSIGDKRGEEMIGEVDKLTPKDGSWHAGKRWHGRGDAQMQGNDFTESKVRIPAKMVGKLIGERGKTVVEISRDSKCRVTIPRVEEGKDTVIIVIRGKKKDITTAQYLMQKILKGGK